MCSVRVQNSGPAPKESTLRRWGRTLWDIVRQVCPRCRRGRIFRGVFAMNDPCPACGLIFQREEGYFLGAMYISYTASVAILVPLYLTLAALLPHWHSALVILLMILLYLPVTPTMFRSARVLWIYLDRAIDPHGILAGSYEKMRLRQLAAQQTAQPADSAGGPPA